MRKCVFRPRWSGLQHTFRPPGAKRKFWSWTTAPRMAQPRWEYFRIKIPTLRVVSNGVNRGKGYSVRHGMQEARGRLALFTDADLSAPIEEASKLIDALDTYDMAIGSRAMDRSLISVHESPFREFAGIIFNKIVRAILWLPFVDTQC